MKEKEYYRNQHHAAMSQLEVAAEESSALRTKYSELVTDKVRLDREISELRSTLCNQGVSINFYFPHAISMLLISTYYHKFLEMNVPV